MKKGWLSQKLYIYIYIQFKMSEDDIHTMNKKHIKKKKLADLNS